MRLPIAMTAVLAIAAIAFAGIATPKNKVLKGSVGPGFVISTKNAAGKKLITTKAGTYDLTIQDKSAFHNFHLTGPGVDVKTEVADVEDTTWTVQLQAGEYKFQCDPHASSMNGSFTVGG